MSQDDLHLVGKILDGKYLLVAVIGQGGYASVYRAQQAKLSRNVAIKVLQAQTKGSSAEQHDFLARFQQEASIAASLQHPGIISIYDYGEVRHLGLAYLVMPYLTHGTLQHALNHYGRFSLRQTVTYIEQAAEALDYAHSQGVVHRDLKPGNFLLNKHGEVILADFGIARLMQQHQLQQAAFRTRTDMFLGTPLYVAPEMILAREIDHRVDLYELGIVCFQMLAGEVPFTGDNDYSILNQHIHASLPQLSQMLPYIPAEVDVVLQKATAKRPEERYSSVGEFAWALRQSMHLSQRFVQPGQPSSPGPYHKVSVPNVPPTVLPTPAYKQPAQLRLTPLPSVQAQTVASNDMTRAALSSSQRKRSKRGLVTVILPLVLLLCVVGAIIFGSALAYQQDNSSNQIPGLVSLPLTRATPTLTPSQHAAIAAVQNRYTHFDNRDYAGFYLLSPKTQASNAVPQGGKCSPSMISFLQGYKNTEHDTITITSVSQPDSQQQYTVHYTITADEVFPTGTRRGVYYIHDVVKQVGSDWKVVNADNDTNPDGTQITPTVGPITPFATSGTASDQAQTAVKQYIDRVNAQDFPTAYNMRSSTYTKDILFCDFVLQNSNKHYDISIMQVIPQTDGTILVVATVSKTLTGGAGNGTSTEQEDFLLAQEKGFWKIISITPTIRNSN